MIWLPNWSSKGILDAPTPVEALGNRLSSNAGFLAPLFNGQPLSHKLNAAIAALIAVLFYACGPSTVTRLVTFGSVNAIDGVIFGWTLSHVSQECREVVLPSVTDCDSCAAVSLEVRGVWIPASVLHIYPNSIGIGFPLSVNGMGCGANLTLIASAANGGSASKSPRSNHLNGATIAYASPIFGAQVFDDGQSAKFFASDVSDIMMELFHD